MDLARFVDAQDAHGSYEQALAELANGCKTSHWMWFVFPQLEGLGHSQMAQRYAISDLAEAQAYAQHETLGPRLRACTRLMLHVDAGAEAPLGPVDAMKLRSCMTLFREATTDPAFQQVLDRHFGGDADELTLRRLSL